MPAVFVETNIEITDPTAMGQEISKLVANVLNKPEKNMTVSFRKAITMIRGGIPTNYAYIEVRSIGGLNPTVNNTLSKLIGELFEKHDLDKSKISLNFMDIAPQNWGKATGTLDKK